FLSGALRTRQWEKDGVKHYSTEVIADHMQMLSYKDNGRKSEQKPAPANTNQDGFDDLEWMDDDIPF
ncbi:MAG: single-stranded DNA-binding protein, partial [Cyclobacteriaceae bacterium]|nr:single-stranded DNA-binding protein [Cyclobacteriaceae bacterium]